VEKELRGRKTLWLRRGKQCLCHCVPMGCLPTPTKVGGAKRGVKGGGCTPVGRSGPGESRSTPAATRRREDPLARFGGPFAWTQAAGGSAAGGLGDRSWCSATGGGGEGGDRAQHETGGYRHRPVPLSVPLSSLLPALGSPVSMLSASRSRLGALHALGFTLSATRSRHTALGSPLSMLSAPCSPLSMLSAPRSQLPALGSTLSPPRSPRSQLPAFHALGSTLSAPDSRLHALYALGSTLPAPGSRLSVFLNLGPGLLPRVPPLNSLFRCNRGRNLASGISSNLFNYPLIRSNLEKP